MKEWTYVYIEIYIPIHFLKELPMILPAGQAKETQTETSDFWTQWEEERVGRFERIALKLYRTICKIDSQGEFGVRYREP